MPPIKPLLALAVIRILVLASIRRLAGSRAGPANASALSPLSSTTSASSRGSRGGAGGASRSGGAATASALAERDLSRTAATPALDSHDLVVQGTEVHASLCPGIEVVLHSNRTARPGALADRDVLVEGRSTLNGRLVDLLVLPDIVSASVARHSALVRACSLVSVVNLHDVVFHQRVDAPSVHGKDTNTRGREGAAIGDGASIMVSTINRILKIKRRQCSLGITWLPTKSHNKVPLCIVVDREGSGSHVGRVLNIGTAGDVVLVVVDRFSAANQVEQGDVLIRDVKRDWFCSRQSQGSSCNQSREGNEDR